MDESVDLDPRGRRKSRRFTLKIPVDIVKDSQRFAFGEVVNISREGAAIEVSQQLVVGEIYSFHFRGFGSWPGAIVRKFGVNSHGVRFDINESQKCRIDEIIRKLLEEEQSGVSSAAAKHRAQ